MHTHVHGWLGGHGHTSSRVGVCRVVFIGMCTHASMGPCTITHRYLLVPVCAYVYMHRNVQVKKFTYLQPFFLQLPFFLTSSCFQQ